MPMTTSKRPEITTLNCISALIMVSRLLIDAE